MKVWQTFTTADLETGERGHAYELQVVPFKVLAGFWLADKIDDLVYPRRKWLPNFVSDYAADFYIKHAVRRQRWARGLLKIKISADEYARLTEADQERVD